MRQISKLLVSVLIVIGLISISVLPAFANNYSIPVFNRFYNPGAYQRWYGHYQPIYGTPRGTKPTIPIQPTKPPIKPPAQPAPAPASGLTNEESKMINLVNQERMGTGVKPLSVNMQLVNLARLKSQDMVKNNYFSHTSPTYGSPFDMIQKAGISYRAAGENIAGAGTTESAHKNLMNSSGHRANILNSSFSQIGIGIAQGSHYGNIFTQMFIGN